MMYQPFVVRSEKNEMSLVYEPIKHIILNDGLKTILYDKPLNYTIPTITQY